MDSEGYVDLEVRIGGDTPPEPLPNRADAADDAEVARFVTFLRAERNASDHTVAGYVQDIGQFAAYLWPDAAVKPPFAWCAPSRDRARAFLVAFHRAGWSPARSGWPCASSPAGSDRIRPAFGGCLYARSARLT